MTDSDSLFKVIIQSYNMTEKRLMIDVQAGREAYHERKIDDMGWVRSENNLADGLTKLNKPELIQRTMKTGRLDIIADQWVIRPSVNDDGTAEHVSITSERTNHDKEQDTKIVSTSA